MPASPTLFRVRLDAPDDSGHYRDALVQADSPEAAQAICEAQERDLVAQAASDGSELEPYAVTTVQEA